jgi:hypothetical protein
LTDITLKLEDGEIRAHRAALAPVSTWFKEYFEKDPRVRRVLYGILDEGN